MPENKPLIQMADKVRLDLNKILGELQQLHTEAVKQQQARVPEMDSVISRCEDCMERISDFKAVNFPNKK